MQFVADIWHRQPMDELRIGLRSGIEVDGREVIGLVDIRARVGINDLSQQFLIPIAENNCALWNDRLITRERDSYVAITAPRDEPIGNTRSYFL